MRHRMQNGARWNAAVLSVAVAVAVLSGCSRSGPETAEAYGTVTNDGQPVTSGRVLFFPVGKTGKNTGKHSQGMLNSDGEFVLGTYDDDDGAVVGDHRVSVLSFPDPLSGIDPRSLGRPDPERVTVRAGESNAFHIKLQPLPESAGRNDEEEED